MSITIQFELDDDDISRLQAAFGESRDKAGDVTREQVLTATRQLVEKDLASDPPAFVRQWLEGLKRLVDMVEDESWCLPGGDCDKIVRMLTYFVGRNAMTPDETPVLAMLDDAIAADMLLSGLRHDIEAYEEFCEYRRAEAHRRANRGLPTDVKKQDWLADRRATLHSRMHERRSADTFGWQTGLFGWHEDTD